MDIKVWATNQCEDIKKTIRLYISEGWDKDKAIETVLSSSIIGAGYKAQIRYEFKREVQP